MIDYSNSSETQRHIALADSLARWIRLAGVDHGETIGDLAVGFADIIHAAKSAEEELKAILTLDPQTPEGAAAALDRLGYLNALFITEIKHHVADLEESWDVLEEALSAKVPDESEP